MKTIGPRRPALSRKSAIFVCTMTRSPGRIGSKYSQSEPPSSPRNESPMSSLTSGIAAESDRPKVGGAIIPPKRVWRASLSLLNSGLVSPIASAKRLIAPRSTSIVRASPDFPICFFASSVTYLFAISISPRERAYFPLSSPALLFDRTGSRRARQLRMVPARPFLRMDPDHDALFCLPPIRLGDHHLARLDRLARQSRHFTDHQLHRREHRLRDRDHFRATANHHALN